MSIIEADYRVLTPMFCAGADRSRPELRAPSFKGVLRFWWRALAWSRLGGELRAIHEEEDHIFGGPGARGSRVSMQILAGPDRPSELETNRVLKVGGKTDLDVGHGVRYLGYGLMNTKSQLLRSCYDAPFSFTVRLRCRNDVDITNLSRALQAAGLFGGLGGRTRRGYGSIALREIKIDEKKTWSEPDSLEALCGAIRECMPAVGPEALPEYTAFCLRSRVIVATAEPPAPLALLDLVGREMIRFRSWGRGGKILENIESEKRFEPDHDVMKRTPAQRTTHPERIAFGLPHNCKEGPVRPKCDWDRRASPLFIHIHQCAGKSVAVLAFLPSVFLPQGTVINVAGASVKLIPESALYKPVSDFLERFVSRQYKEPFTGTFEVRP